MKERQICYTLSLCISLFPSLYLLPPSLSPPLSISYHLLSLPLTISLFPSLYFSLPSLSPPLYISLPLPLYISRTPLYISLPLSHCAPLPKNGLVAPLPPYMCFDSSM